MVALSLPSQSQLFEEELHKAELGYCLPGSEPFWSHEEIQDILTFLKLIANPLAADCELLQAALTRPDRGVDAGMSWRIACKLWGHVLTWKPPRAERTGCSWEGDVIPLASIMRCESH